MLLLKYQVFSAPQISHLISKRIRLLKSVLGYQKKLLHIIIRSVIIFTHFFETVQRHLTSKVKHSDLFDKLLNRKVPPLITRIIMHMYMNGTIQHIYLYYSDKKYIFIHMMQHKCYVYLRNT